MSLFITPFLLSPKSCTTLASVCEKPQPFHICVLQGPGLDFSLLILHALLVCLPRLSCSQPTTGPHNFWFCTPKPADALPLRHTHVHTAVPSSQIPGLTPSLLLLRLTHSRGSLGTPSLHSLNQAEPVGTYVMLKCVIQIPAPAGLPFPGNTGHHNEHGAI